MMFTIKYRQFQPCAKQPVDGPVFYDENEQIHGPFDFVSQERQDGYLVVHCHRGSDPGYTFGPWTPAETAGENPPRPTVWVMNAQGATIAKYDL